MLTTASTAVGSVAGHNWMNPLNGGAIGVPSTRGRYLLRVILPDG
jgi:hypothetical protein